MGMTQINIDDEVWKVYSRSLALLGIMTHGELVAMLEDQLMEESLIIVENAEG
jgi:hypothetical protein